MPDPSIEELRIALAESLCLQSHYAKQLNMRDGGDRAGFVSIDEWVERLKETGAIDTRFGARAALATKPHWWASTGERMKARMAVTKALKKLGVNPRDRIEVDGAMYEYFVRETPESPSHELIEKHDKVSESARQMAAMATTRRAATARAYRDVLEVLMGYDLDTASVIAWLKKKGSE